MQDKIKESISALIDNELSEIEVHRLLRQYAEDPTIKESWISYQQISSATQDEPGALALTVAQHISLHDRISAAIEEEDSFATDKPLILANTRKSVSRWYKPVAGFAVAASLVVAVSIGINTSQQPGTGAEVASTNNTPNTTKAGIEIQPVNTSNELIFSELVAEAPFENNQLELKELDEASQERLRRYLMQHERMSRSNIRTASFQSNVIGPPKRFVSEKTVVPAQSGDKN